MLSRSRDSDAEGEARPGIRRTYDEGNAFFLRGREQAFGDRLAARRVRSGSAAGPRAADGIAVMSAARVFGFALMGVGVVLVVLGIVASQSLADSLATTFLGRLTRNTLWYFVGGGASIVIGLILAVGTRDRGGR